MLQLYDYFRSSASFRVRIALNLKGVAYNTLPIHLVNNGGEQHSLDYQSLNPHCLVPTLKDDDKAISQSLAIIEYVDELYPEPNLLPKDPYQKALVRSFALAIIADIHPLNNLRVLRYLTDELGVTEDEKMQWYRHWLTLGLAGLEEQLNTWQCAGQFCFGDTPSLADICLVPQLYNARRFSCDLTSFPTLTQIDSHCQSLPAVKQAWPQD
jgi:maleylpyruvate isomerase